MQENPAQDLSASLLTMRIIVFALTMGLVFFLAIVLLLPKVGMRDAGGSLPLITFIALGFAAMLLVARAVLLTVMTGAARREMVRGMSAAGRGPSSAAQPDGFAGKLLAFYQKRLIVGAAMLEGATFFLLIAYMLERSPWALAVAILEILGVAAHFPTQSGVAAWIEDQSALLAAERELEAPRRD